MEHKEAWQQLGKALAAARKPRTQQQIATRIDVSLNTVKDIEAGKGFKKVTHSIRAYAREVGWTENSPEQILAGGEPELATPAPAPEGEAPDQPEDASAADAAVMAKLPMRVHQELESGAVLDTLFTYVNREGVDLRLITVAVIPADATPEQRRRLAEEWRLTEERMRRIQSGDLKLSEEQ